MMNRLTPAEDQVMLKLWKLESSSVKDIVTLYREPKPAYNTISTIVRILENKGFIKHITKGRGFSYSPKISKEEYKLYVCNYLLENYFEGNVSEYNSFLK